VGSLPDNLGLSAFRDDYINLLATARGQLGTVEHNLVTLTQEAASGRLNGSGILDQYIDAMAVQYHGLDVFLPCQSDRCLGAIGAGSPFRGLRYCWELGEASYALRRKEYDHCDQILDGLLREMTARGAPIAGVSPDDNIRQAKAIFRDIVLQVKDDWTKVFPYPCRTSSHFYLSGIRFYWNPLLRSSWASRGSGTHPNFGPSDRYCVQSTSSGLFSARERYGFLVPLGLEQRAQRRAVDELLEAIPVGSLRLDLSDPEPVEADRQALTYFENWSRLVTDRATPIVVRAKEELAAARQLRDSIEQKEELKQVSARLEQRAGKNPLRTFYFDCGLLAMAQRHRDDPSGTPYVQYLTTQASDPRSDPSGRGQRMFNQIIGTYGRGLHIYAEQSTSFGHPQLARWTLVPYGRGLHGARTLCSYREQSATPIMHGFEARLGRRISEQALRTVRDRKSDAIGLLGATTATELLDPSTLSAAAMCGALTLLLTCAIQTSTGTALNSGNPHSVHHELGRVPESQRYRRIQELADWDS
jgi:hypothetical protein